MKLFHGTHHSVTELPMGSKSDANLPDPHSPTMLHHKIKKGKRTTTSSQNSRYQGGNR